MEVIQKSEPMMGVSIEVSKSTKGIYTWIVKINDLEDFMALTRIKELTANLDKTYKNEIKELIKME